MATLRLPTLERIGQCEDESEIGPLGLWLQISGRVLVRDEAGHTAQLQPGDLLVVRRESARIRAQPGSAEREALLFRASESWVLAARSLGAPRIAEGASALCIEASGTDTAERAAKQLVEGRLRLDAGADPSAGVEMARAVALLAVATEANGPFEVTERRTRTAYGERRRADLIRALGGLEEGPLEGWSLGAFAERLGLSERHTSRLFRRELGRSFNEYMVALRIERAKKLLLTSDAPITDVAMQTGWGSLSHFNATFRRRVGVTPSRFRRRRCGIPGPVARADSRLDVL